MNQKAKSKSENNYAFIDAQNLHNGVKREQNWKIDYARFRILLRDKYKVKKAFLFIGYIPENQDLYTYLQQCGFICVFKQTLPIIDKNTKKITYKGNVDAELVLEAVSKKDAYDKAVIITSDGDFACLIKYLVKHNKLEKLITTHLYYSSLLKQYAQFITPISVFKNKIKKEHSRKP